MAPIATNDWLRRCEGFRVERPNGRVGVVENVVYESAIDKPSALLVRRGFLGARLIRIEIDEVEEIRPSLELLRLRGSVVATGRIHLVLARLAGALHHGGVEANA